MRRQQRVVWQEGMFISPQHFQQQDRHYRHYVEQYAVAAGHDGYGLCELQIDRERLKIGKIVITVCKGVFPDNTYFESNHELLLNVPENTLNKSVFLALPLVVDGEVEYGAAAEKRRHLVEDITLFDTSDASTNSVDAKVARPNIRLLLEGEDTTGLTVIPVARILERRESGAIILDQRFIPASLHYGASALLTERLQELQVLIETRANMVQQRIGNGQQSMSEQSLLREYLWLQTLNRWIPWLTHTLDNPQTLTQEVYLKLATFSAELNSFTPAIAKPLASLQYDAMHRGFMPLFAKLREQLSVVQKDSVLEFPWDTRLFEKRRLLRASVADISNLSSHRFILCVESSIGSAALSQLVPSACKLCGLSQIAEVVRNALSGVTLTSMPVAPSELKSKSDAAYIEIDTHHPYWQSLVEKREPLALHVDVRIPDIKIKLYVLD
ncbi:type VI secretion system baseplate subunit TssK [Aliamphritea ceti]|uniref:type VI secretion system baseplate subunit TssK n=1 Tax=Aliamphritea ceti TaxID=1524258 RepID=UPI0021C331A6|nr:type VI secretion system baseplate subunit TssK [Aliamphritea ceti]